jgi:hypothetical protein
VVMPEVPVAIAFAGPLARPAMNCIGACSE